MLEFSISNRCRRVMPLFALSLLIVQFVLCVQTNGSLDTIQWLHDGADFTKLSDIRAQTIGRPIEEKCDLYESALREMIVKGEDKSRSTLFANVIVFLEEKELPVSLFRLLAQLKACQEPQEHPVGKDNYEQADKNDGQFKRDDAANNDAAMGALKREFEKSRRELAIAKKELESRSQLAAELDSQLAASNASLREKSIELEKMRQLHEELKQKCTSREAELMSKSKDEIDKSRRELERAERTIKLDMDDETSWKIPADSILGELLVDRARVRRFTFMGKDDIDNMIDYERKMF